MKFIDIESLSESMRSLSSEEIVYILCKAKNINIVEDNGYYNLELPIGTEPYAKIFCENNFFQGTNSN